jgi:glycosyltransferase involved in cell wall biosynthesis
LAKTILHIIDTLERGGAEVLLKNTLPLLSEYQHVVVYLSGTGALKSEFLQGTMFYCLDHEGWRNFPETVVKLKAIIKEQGPILIHSHLFVSTVVARIATPKSVPLFTTLHSTFSIDAFQKNKKSLWIERLTLRKRHILIGVSKYVLDDYLNHVSFRGKRFVLHNFLPDDFFQCQITQPPLNGLKCIAVGNLKEAKNYNYLLEIFSKLKHTDITLDIFGEGTIKEQLQKEIDDNHLPVRLLGKATNTKDLFNSYHLFVQASSHEGFGISVIEAMAARLPVLISDIEVLREISSGNAHFFPLDSQLEAADVFIRLQNDPVERIKHVEAAFDFCRLYYSSKVYKQKLSFIYSLCPKATV